MPRRVEFIGNGGKRLIVAAQNVVDVWRKYSRSIPAQFALGTAQHESSFTVNERDTEESGYVSHGIFQLAAEEADSVYHHGANLLDLEEATIVFAAIQEKRLTALLNAVGNPTPTLQSSPYPDVWAYLFIAHNQGLAAAVKTIKTHGMDWKAYKARNAVHPEWSAYGDDVISGGIFGPCALTPPKGS